MSAPAFKRTQRLELIGEGTGDVEALTSLLTRVADEYSISTGTLLTRLFGVDDVTHRPRTCRREYLYSINGYGPNAVRFGGLIEQELQKNVVAGTLQSWGGFLDPVGHSLLSTERRWCPHCLAEDVQAGRAPYQRLYWCIQPVETCVHHKVPLQKACSNSNCKVPQQQYIPGLPRMGNCDCCGHSLVASERPTVAVEHHNSRAIYELLDATQRSLTPISQEMFLAWLKKLCAHHAGSATQLAGLIGMDRSNFKRWVSGEAKPGLKPLLDFCDSVRCPVATLVGGEPELGEFQLFPTAVPPAKRAFRTARELQKIQSTLEEYVRRPVDQAVSLKQIATHLKSAPAFLHTKYLDLTKQIVAKHRQKVDTENKARRMDREEELVEVLERCKDGNVYPGSRVLKRELQNRWQMISPPTQQLLIKKYQTLFSDRSDC